MAMVIPSLILLAGLVDDIFSRKVHNWLFLSLMGLATAYCLYVGGFSQLVTGLVSGVTAFLLLSPMVALKVLGAGDLKLMVAFGMSTNWESVLMVTFYSLAWAALFGLIRAGLDGKLKDIINNIRKLLIRQQVASSELNRIPYTVPLFFGWLSSLMIQNGRWI